MQKDKKPKLKVKIPDLPAPAHSIPDMIKMARTLGNGLVSVRAVLVKAGILWLEADQKVMNLKSKVAKLEAKVAVLEARLAKKTKK